MHKKPPVRQQRIYGAVISPCCRWLSPRYSLHMSSRQAPANPGHTPLKRAYPSVARPQETRSESLHQINPLDNFLWSILVHDQ